MANHSFRKFAGTVICAPVRIAKFILRYPQRIAYYGAPFVAFEIFNWIFDNVSFFAGIESLGPIWGVLAVMASALVLNAGIYWAYEHLKIDWLHAYEASQLKDKENKDSFEKLITWHRTPKVMLGEKIKGAFVFVALTIPLDPVVLAIYYRESYFRGISKRDWETLILATIAASIMWGIIWNLGLWLVKLLIHLSHLTILELL